MRVLVQRVRSAEVQAGGQTVGRIEQGLLVYLGVAEHDTAAQARWLAEKVAEMRIFEDQDQKMNLSVRDVRGGVLAVPSFTLLADARKGRRPTFDAAARPEAARPLFDEFTAALEAAGLPVARGVFGEMMFIRSDADGPVNIILDAP
ncbi:MAG: D-aminoacyl-tRNA deacylase [Phycisphaerae bacterium]|nr:D-aminoacyl-tRNA deacylase [Phycisphaerae bacterium]